MSDPRRRAKRIECNLTFRGGGASTNLHGRITDLSGTGLFLATRQFVPLGRQVHLEFELPTGGVEAVGEVRWVARGNDVPEQGLGIRFLRLSASAARAIDAAVEGKVAPSLDDDGESPEGSDPQA